MKSLSNAKLFFYKELENDVVDNECIDIKSLSSFVNLERVTLYQASLFDSSFQGLFRLEYLVLSDCDFKNFKSESFRYVPNLEKLQIVSSQNFYDINFNELSKLNKLWLDESWDISECLRNENLESLRLQFIDDYFDGMCISGLPKLKSLSLTSLSKFCNFKCYSLNYDFFSRLESLELENFHFLSFEFLNFLDFSNLKKLTFNDCSVERNINQADVFKRLGKLEKLTITNFSDLFNEIPSTFFDDLENLTELDILRNELINIHPDWFSRMQKLERLSLRHNKLNRLAKEMFRHLSNLKHLSLFDNEFNQLDDGAFSYLKNLTYLEISYSKTIRELRPQVFAGLEKLTNLEIYNLHDDFQLDVDLFQVLPSLKQVYLDERFKEMQSQLSEKYGSQIIFVFY